MEDIDRIEIERNLRHKEQFLVLAKDHKVLSECKDSSFKVGDKVTFTNHNGCVFYNHEVLGFCEKTSFGGFIYVDLDCYWFPVKENELTLQTI